MKNNLWLCSLTVMQLALQQQVYISIKRKSRSVLYEGVSNSFRTESITRYTLTTINTRWEATQRVMAAKLARMTYQIAIQVHLVAESCTICSSRSRRPVRILFGHIFVCRTPKNIVGKYGHPYELYLSVVKLMINLLSKMYILSLLLLYYIIAE
jgi:hypothetical protein